MIVRLLGLRPVEFTNKETGEVVEGISLYFAFPDADVYGEVADKKFISNDVIEKLHLNVDEFVNAIGSDIDIMLNPRGRLSAISVCQKKAL